MNIVKKLLCFLLVIALFSSFSSKESYAAIVDNTIEPTALDPTTKTVTHKVYLEDANGNEGAIIPFTTKVVYSSTDRWARIEKVTYGIADRITVGNTTSINVIEDGFNNSRTSYSCKIKVGSLAVQPISIAVSTTGAVTCKGYSYDGSSLRVVLAKVEFN